MFDKGFNSNRPSHKWKPLIEFTLPLQPCHVGGSRHPCLHMHAVRLLCDRGFNSSVAGFELPQWESQGICAAQVCIQKLVPLQNTTQPCEEPPLLRTLSRTRPSTSFAWMWESLKMSSRSADKPGCCWLQSGNTVFRVADFSTRTEVTIESAQQKDSLFFYCSITLNRLVQSDYFKYLTQRAAASSWVRSSLIIGFCFQQPPSL